MDLVTGTLGMLPSKLLQLLNDEYKLQKGVRAQVQSLARELEATHAALLKVGQVPPDELDPQVRLWAREVRDASYDMEDILDAFFLAVRARAAGDDGPDSRVGRLAAKMGKLLGHLGKLKARHQVAGAIEGINKKLREIAERRARYRIDELAVAKQPAAAAASVVDPRLPALYADASQLVGIDEPRDAVVEMLGLGEEEKIKIVSVVGFGGLGKTTLAKTVYDKVGPRFDCRALVPVGRDPDQRKVLRDILIGLIDSQQQDISIGRGLDRKRYNCSDDVVDLAVLDERQLIDKLRKFLDKQRYLIVTDDIWDISVWETVSIAFVDSSNGSTIIATTRNSQVAAEIGGQVYRLKELSDANSKKLFHSRIFGRGADDRPSNSDELDEVSDNIIQKCEGVPLAIIAVASVLVTKPTKEWREVYNSIGFGQGDNSQVKNMMKIISFSYYDLPCNLRACLLHLNVFIDSYYFEKNELIWRWIAEGLVHEQGGKELFEVGESYFHELINRSMILPIEEKDQGLILSCRVHDMVLHLIRDLSSTENYAAILDGEHQLPLAAQQVSARRLAFQKLLGAEQKQKQISDMGGVESVRSCDAIICDAFLIPPVSSFKVLRVLALVYCSGMESYHLENIGELHHLRYLRLSYTRIRKLPAQVGRLKSLQTLLLDDTGVEELPASMRRLSRLMCLRADKKTRAPEWIGELVSLVELEMYSAGADDAVFVKELGKLKDLLVLKTKVTARGDDRGLLQLQGRELLESLGNLQKVRVMEIASAHNDDFMDELEVVMQPGFALSPNLRVLDLQSPMFSRLPAWIAPSLLPNLCCLVLYLYSAVGEQDLEILGSFPHLRALTLFNTDKHEVTRTVVGDDGRFQNLRYLAVNSRLQFLQGAMPGLKAIVLGILVRRVKDDKLGQEIGLGNLASLQEVGVLIHCDLARPEEVEEVEATVRHEVDAHPNRPTLKAKRQEEDGMLMGDAQDSRILSRQLYKRKGAIAQLNNWIDLHNAFFSGFVNMVSPAIDEEHPILVKILELNLLFQKAVERAHCERLSKPKGPGDAPGLIEANQDIAVLERLAKLFRVNYPLLVAPLLEELKAELNHQVEEAETVDIRDAFNKYLDCSALQATGSGMLRWRIKEQIVKLQYRAQAKRLAMLRSDEVLERTEAIPDWHRIYAKRKQFIDHSNNIVECANNELLLWDEDNEEDRSLCKVIEDTAALERALNMYEVEYPRLVAMLEELKAEFIEEEEAVSSHPLYLFAALRNEASEITSQTVPNGHPLALKINEFIDEYNDAVERVSQLSQLCSGPDGRADAEIFDIYTAEYRRLAAMLEEVKNELKQQLEDDGVDTIS